VFFFFSSIFFFSPLFPFFFSCFFFSLLVFSRFSFQFSFFTYFKLYPFASPSCSVLSFFILFVNSLMVLLFVVWLFDYLSVWAFDCLIVTVFDCVSIWLFGRLIVRLSNYLIVWLLDFFTLSLFQCLSVWGVQTNIHTLIHKHTYIHTQIPTHWHHDLPKQKSTNLSYSGDLHRWFLNMKLDYLGIPEIFPRYASTVSWTP